MTYWLTVTHCGKPLISCSINTVYGRTLILFGLTFPQHFIERAQDAQVLLGKLVRTIEDALQENPEAHERWMTLCASGSPEPAIVDVVSDLKSTKAAPSDLHGGDGGDAAWPAGGGGGGGRGPLGSKGGNGADGGAMVFEYDADGNLIDLETFVLPGSFHWTVPPGVVSVKAVLFGGGGGGAGTL